MVVVMNLLNNRGQPEKEFKVEVEADGLFRLIQFHRFSVCGYCSHVFVTRI
ncbi:hypothetical protein Hanom_Chr04g00311501 [Helianthus anomalus]